MLELIGNRTLAFKVRGRAYTLTLQQITPAMWLKYFAEIISTETRNEDGEIEGAFDSSGAGLSLLQSALVDCSGYNMSDEQRSASEWQSKLPVAHRRAAAAMLTTTYTDDLPQGDDFTTPPFGMTLVSLRAMWSADGDGVMSLQKGLHHIFREPTAEQQMRYSRANSRTVADGRNGTTRYLGAQDVMIELYDELISAVHGYSAHGTNLEQAQDSISAITGQMDASHKVVALRALFRPVEVE